MIEIEEDQNTDIRPRWVMDPNKLQPFGTQLQKSRHQFGLTLTEVETRELSRKEKRLERKRAWRAANRAYLREYLRQWKKDHPDRVRAHRQTEFAKRRSKRRRLRLRREAQRRRRAMKRLEILNRYPPNLRRWE